MKSIIPISIVTSCTAFATLFFNQPAKPPAPGNWTWPGDGSPQSLSEHLQDFHRQDTSASDMNEMLETHDAIHDQIGPVKFDNAGNAFGPGIGFVPNQSTFSSPAYRFNTSGYSSNGVRSYPANYGSKGVSQRYPVQRNSYGSRGSRAGSSPSLGWRVRRLFQRRGYGSRG